MKFAKALLAILALGSAAHLSASESRPDVNIGIGANSGNYCAGGLEDRKLIELGDGVLVFEEKPGMAISASAKYDF